MTIWVIFDPILPIEFLRTQTYKRDNAHIYLLAMIPRLSPLTPLHEQMGAKFTTFGGWKMPIRFGSIIEEHNCVRTSVGKFDVSHMGQIFLDGTDAEYLTNKLVSSNNKLILKCMVGNNVKFIDCSCNGKNLIISPSTTRYRPLLNDGQEKPSSTMKN